MDIPLINVADLTKLVESGKKIHASAVAIDGVADGYFLDVEIDSKDKKLVKIGGQNKRLSTYLSDKPRLFKRADALIKEAKKIGLTSVTFNLD